MMPLKFGHTAGSAGINRQAGIKKDPGFTPGLVCRGGISALDLFIAGFASFLSGLDDLLLYFARNLLIVRKFH